MIQTGIMFGDSEAQMIAALKLRLNALDDPKWKKVRVSTEKASGQVQPQPEFQVIINTDGGPVINLLKEERLRINLFANSKQDINKLSNIVAALLGTIFTENIKYVSVSAGPYDVDYEGKEYQRYIAVEATVSASNFDIEF